MVHALHGIWRVLARGGTLIDLRPLPSRCPVDAVTADTIVHVGEVDGTGMVAEDVAADGAIREVVERGWFVRRHDTNFEFEFYWDSVPEMCSFIAGTRRMKHVVPSQAELENVLRSLSAQRGGEIRLRCRRPTLVAVYEKAMLGAVDTLVSAV